MSPLPGVPLRDPIWQVSSRIEVRLVANCYTLAIVDITYILYLGLNHQDATHSHLVDDGKDVDDVVELQLLRQHVQCDERASTTHAGAIQYHQLLSRTWQTSPTPPHTRIP